MRPARSDRVFHPIRDVRVPMSLVQCCLVSRQCIGAQICRQ